MANVPNLSVVRDPGKPRKLGRYELEECLGAEGGRETYRARVRGLAGFDRIFAVKCLRRHAGPVGSRTDPFLVAADTHMLMSRRNDPVRIYNAGSMYVHCAEQGPDAVVQLVNFARRESANLISVGVSKHYTRALFHTLTAEPAPIKPVPVGLGVEFQLPPFALCAALELGGAK